jgi:hypothetical protein
VGFVRWREKITQVVRIMRRVERRPVTAWREWPSVLGVLFLVVGMGQTPSLAQSIETVGTRALGMGGAFVSVANDSSATWWNPAALAAGPFLDVAIARTLSAVDGSLPAARTGVWSFALVTPPFGASYYRYRVTEVPGIDPIAQERAGREETGDAVAVRSLSVSQFGATILHTVLTGVHVGGTVKYVRGTARRGVVPGAEASLFDIPDLLDAGDDLSNGDSEGTVDFDFGVLAVVGAIRAGGVARNVTEPDFDGMRLPRQVRVGAAFDGEAAGLAPFVISLDADVLRYDGGAGDKRVVAVGGEHWLLPRRVALRGGARFDTVGPAAGVVTAGGTVSPRAGFFVDGHVALGGEAADGGWGVAARVSF